MSVLFYLGTHLPQWLGQYAEPLFVSRRRLAHRKTFPRALGQWALDSGGFSELSMYGHWKTDAKTYVAEVRRFSQEIGGLQWAAIQDWMCEPAVREKTGRTVAEHQELSLRSYLELRSLAPEVSWTPVVQGWSRGEYLDHVEQYARAGVDLARLPVVGVGSVCRRQESTEVAAILQSLAAGNLRLHGFGVKLLGLALSAGSLASCDSMAWSYDARFSPPLRECRRLHRNCANCPRYAFWWRLKALSAAASGARPPARQDAFNFAVHQP